jgi:succinate-semialdehyde dehydrogenase/glutarate-semialdehyde dehydrogenase
VADVTKIGKVRDKNLIGAEWVPAQSGETIPVTNPANDEVIAEVPRCGAAETRLAIEAAAEALPGWRARTAGDRGARLRKLHDLMMRDQDSLARLLTMEQGKPLAEARGEIAYAAGFIDWAADEGKRIYGETVPASAPNKRLLVLRQPVGVTAAITPWNFPIAMITRKLGPALAAGCTMVVKPAKLTPLLTLAFADLALEAGIPPGVICVVTGDAGPIGGEMLSNATVRKVSFTGSTEIGQVLMRLAAQNITRLSLELGGHAPFLVFDDADVDAAVQGAIASKFRNAGQTCVCANRFYVQDGIYDAFVARFRRAVSELKVGPGWHDGVEIGPLIDDAAVEKVEAHVEDARARGGEVTTGGRRVDVHGFAPRFYAPTLIERASQDMAVMREETFGPVAPVYRFGDEHEAIELANDSPFGLASYFYTRNASRLLRVAEALEYGIVGANDGMPSVPQAPFGGVKTSGLGREGGRYVMAEYLETKYVSWGI